MPRAPFMPSLYRLNQQANIRMRSDGLRQQDYDKSVAFFPKTCCKLIVIQRLDASCFNKSANIKSDFNRLRTTRINWQVCIQQFVDYGDLKSMLPRNV